MSNLPRGDGGPEALATEADQRLGIDGLRVGAQGDERLDDRARDGVGLADDTGLDHRGMLHQHALHLERPDQVSGGLDHVVGAPEKPEVALFVPSGEVAAEVPVAGEALRVALGVAFVRPEHRGPAAADRQLALDAGFLDHSGATVIGPLHDRSVDARHRAPHRPRLDVEAGVVGYHDPAGLGLPPVVVDRLSEGFDAPVHRFGVERLADAADEAKARQVVLADQIRARFHQHADRGRSRVPDRDTAVGDGLVPAPRVELRLVHDEGDAAGQRRNDPVGDAGNPAGVGGAPVDIARGQVEGEATGGVVDEHRLVDVQCALGGAGGARW